MTETISAETDIDPERLFENGRVDTKRLTLTHEDAEQHDEHCEADTVGRTIVGVTDASGRVLLVIHPGERIATLPHDTVAPDGEWATVGRNWVEGAAGVDVTIEDIERVRRVEHAIENRDSVESVTYQIVFGASVPSTGTIPDGLCAENPFELGWYGELPFEMDDAGPGILDDIRLFLD
jgi:hypothetical protein